MLLKLGSKGEEVKTLQMTLRLRGYNIGKGGPDGIFGADTEKAVKKFQKDHKLDADGIVGPATQEALHHDYSGNTDYGELIKIGSNGPQVAEMQRLLIKAGYSVGSAGADGIFGSGTENAVRRFQESRGLAVDGIIGPDTKNALKGNSGSSSKLLKLGSRGPEVKELQRLLINTGYSVGSYGADGVFGAGTESAVKRFQEANGLAKDGIVGPATWNTLFGTSSNSGSNGGGSTGSGTTGNIRKVFIDPGHGGSDPGAIGNGLNEKDIVLSLSKKIGNILTSRGIQVKYSRTSDTYLSLSDRASQANGWGADLFVSIHCNSFSASSANGTECFTHPTANSSTKALSKNVANSLTSKLSLTNRGHKEANFAVLRLSNMPAILIETAFISNSSDATKLKNRQDDFAIAIANQILGHSNGGSSGGGSGAGSGSGYSRVLRLTNPLMYGEDVRAVQNRLNSLGYSAGTADGYYGETTKSSVTRFQLNHGLDTDGVVGPTTWDFLFGSSISDIIKIGRNTGLFENCGFEIERLNVKSPVKMLSIRPTVYVQGELSLTEKLIGQTSNYINLSYSADTIATSLVSKLNTAGVDFNFSKKSIIPSIQKLTAARNINDILKYSITVEKDGTLIITLEASISKRSTTTNVVVTYYQRVIITVKPSLLPKQAILTTPIASSDPANNHGIDILLGLVTIAVICGAIYVGGASGALASGAGAIFFKLKAILQGIMTSVMPG